MKLIYSIPILAFGAIVSGCATSSQVQEMIDASNRDYQAKSELHDASIDLLKNSAMISLEKGTENADSLIMLQARMDKSTSQLETIKKYAEASKVYSAANTVKVANLEDAMQTSQDAMDETIRRMDEIDALYEKVMVQHYQTLADSALAAIEALKADGVMASTNAPVNLDEPIEIIAPDTSAPTTNAQSAE